MERNRPPSPWARLACLLALLLAAPAAADPCPPEERDVKLLAQSGLAIYRAALAEPDHASATRQLAQALRCYQAVLRVGQSPAPIYHPMGLVLEKLGRSVEAYESFSRYLALVPEAERPPGASRQVVDKLRQLEPLIGRLDIDTAAGLAVRVDQRPVGRSPLGQLVVVAPGSHSVQVGDAEAGTLGAEVQVAPGQVRRVDLTGWRRRGQPTVAVAPPAPPPPTPLYKRWWLWTTLGAVVAAGAVTGAVLGTQPRAGADTGMIYTLQF